VAVAFQQTGSAPFWLLTPPSPVCSVAFTPFDLAKPPPPTLSLAETWSTYPGTHLVAPLGTLFDATLAASLAAFRAGRPLRIVWAGEPQAYGAYWDASWIASAPGSGLTSGLGRVALGSYALWIGDGCSIAPDGDGEAIAIAPRPGDASSVYLTAGTGAGRPGTGFGPVTVSFAAAKAGCALGSATLENGGPGDDFDRLDVGMRIFAADETEPLLPGRLASWRYPVLQAAQPPSGESIPVSFSIHPLLPLDPLRTSLDLVPVGADEGPELGSCYVSGNGRAVHLVPLAPAGAPPRAARLVPAVRALSDGSTGGDPLYLVPSGAFRIKVIGDGGEELSGRQSLLCGKSGIDLVKLEQPGCELWFAPGGPALAVGKGLQGDPTTAYASVFGPGGAKGRIYRAQADAAPLFVPGSEGFMSFRELSGSELPAAPAGEALPPGYPLLAYTGIEGGGLERYAQLEYQAVASTRRAAIAKLAPPSRAAGPAGDPPPTTPGTTPQGLLADVTADGHVVNLTLALSGAGAIELIGITPELAAALQSNQLFLVASEPKTLAQGQPSASGASTLPGAPPLTGEVRIPGSPDGSQVWAIDAWPAAPWAETETLLVLKFAGKPLVELAADTKTWAGEEGVQFNPGSEGVGRAQAVLQALIEEARTSEAPEFQPFAELALDPSWQGVLFLNAPVPPAELPTEIAGLAAGIEPKLFRAHHVGLTVTPVTSSQGQISPSLSSFFGLIFYQSPNSAAGAAPPYAFNVLDLRVRFESSAVKSFASRIELLVDQLFGEPAALVDPAKELQPLPASVLVLDGAYQQQGDSGAYTFTTPGDNLFSMTSAVLDSVDVALAQFVTVIAPDPSGTTKRAESRFVLSGSLRFKPALAGALDVFSFGPESTVKPEQRISSQRLAYSNLWIDLAYTPGERAEDVYTFDASKTIPDPAQSVPREKALFAGFPLTPTSLVQARKPEPVAPPATPPAPATPASLGFLGIGTEPPLGTTIEAPWFGLVADLGFGTAGALAAEAGFKASMLFAWTPGKPETPNAGVGLKLPGTGPGGKLLSLQGVLKLKIGELALSEHEDTYLLALDRIALSVLMLTLPSSGQFDALLFADPTGRDHTTLGWYAGYAKGGNG